MTDRLSAIGGNLVFDTAPGHGTRVTATLKTPGTTGVLATARKGCATSWCDRPSALSLETRTEDVGNTRAHVDFNSSWFVCAAGTGQGG
jgi:hypothetical protein